MVENQNIEWKERWLDEYLKWIFGFANAKRLMDDFPNKIVTNLGVICDINLHSGDEKDYIEIIVEPYPNPVNYKGQLPTLKTIFFGNSRASIVRVLDCAKLVTNRQ